MVFATRCSDLLYSRHCGFLETQKAALLKDIIKGPFFLIYVLTIFCATNTLKIYLNKNLFLIIIFVCKHYRLITLVNLIPYKYIYSVMFNYRYLHYWEHFFVSAIPRRDISGCMI